MNANLQDVVKKIIADQGLEVMNDSKRVNAYLNDLAPKEPKAEKKAFVTCLMNGFHAELKNGAADERQLCKNRLAQRLHDDEGLEMALCNDTLDLLEGVLFGEQPQKLICRSCGKELQSEWKICPYCSAAVPEPVVQPTPAPQPVIQAEPELQVTSSLLSVQDPQAAPSLTPVVPKKHTKQNVLIAAGVILVVIIIAIAIANSGNNSQATHTTSTTQAAQPANIVTVTVPGNLRVTQTEATSVSLVWDSVGAGVSYQVYNGTENNPANSQLLGSIDENAATITQLEAGTAYYFWVSAVKDGQESGKSIAVSARTATAIPGDMVRIQGGTFMMGSPSSEVGHDDDEVQHQVTVSSFYMGKYEVTQKEYQALMGTNPSNFKGDNLPVESVTWYDAVNYCNARSRSEGLAPAYTVSGIDVTWNRSANGYRLPTEAEWEYACRAGTTTPYSSGSSVDVAGWYISNSGNTNHPVGAKQANGWGLYDMHGNVYEWCWDWYGYYPGGAQNNPGGAVSGASRVNRGGSWISYGRYLRSAFRIDYGPGIRYSDLGFRLVRP
jgi:formylglycine-generating enzyme required for sulfatase activity